MLGKIIKLVTFFLSLFPYYLLLLVVQAEKEWMSEKRQGYFQLFLGEQCYFPNQKIAVFPVLECIDIWEEVSYGARKPIFSGMSRLSFLSETSWKILIFSIYLFYFVFILFFISINFILCLFYFYFYFCVYFISVFMLLLFFLIFYSITTDS